MVNCPASWYDNHVKKLCNPDQQQKKSVYPAKDPRIYQVQRNERGLFPCPHEEGCDEAFKSRGQLMHHFCNKHDRKKCPYCFKMFSYHYVSHEAIIMWEPDLKWI